ncbi:hypothetical protein CANINC_002313 [Pichia inconspicua]|uniref:Uncharacterized protein n=1 Tax=Pichia inconspicua TaxID=52247 RepID=A0A4T0X1X6_9ASCO|nr:hypothetical protein CANINC_002313 [[Candida] inconspicua]
MTQTAAVVIDCNSTGINAALSHRTAPQISVDPVYASGYRFDPILPNSENDEIYTLFNHGLLYDPNSILPLFQHVYKGLNIEENIKDLPLAFSQNAWFDKKQLNSITQVVYEELEIPIFSIHQRQISTAYAMSKPNSCIVVDIENDYISVTPISNGKVLRKAIITSPYGGNYINLFVQDFFNKNNIPEIDLLPFDYQDKKLTTSFKQYAIQQTFTDFKTAIVDISPNSMDSKIFKTALNKHSVAVSRIEMYNNFVQPIFTPYKSYTGIINSNPPSSVPSDAEGLGQLIFKSLKSIGGQSNLYADLLNNIVIQGAMSFIPGLEDAILNDLRLYINDYQLSSYLNQDDMDRDIETWIGTSILSQFKDLYVTKEDYEEHGIDRVYSRFV